MEDFVPLKKEIKENNMDWTQVLVMVLGNAAFIIPLFLWNRAEANSDRRDMLTIISGIQDEMKDFHGRLERQDAEFKAHLMYSPKEK